MNTQNNASLALVVFTILLTTYLSLSLVYLLAIFPWFTDFILSLTIYQDVEKFLLFGLCLGLTISLLSFFKLRKNSALLHKILYTIRIIFLTVIGTYFVFPIVWISLGLLFNSIVDILKALTLVSSSFVIPGSFGLEIYIVYPLYIGLVISLFSVKYGLSKRKNNKSKPFKLFY